MPLYGYGETEGEALDNLKAEIESLYFDLMEDDNFSPDWIEIKERLNQIIEK